MRVIIALILLLLVGCKQEALKVIPTNNDQFKIEELFTHSGCTVFRFNDDRPVYYTVCDRNQTSTQSLFNCGKGCVASRQVTTSYKEE